MVSIGGIYSGCVAFAGWCMACFRLLKSFLILRNGPDYLIGAGYQWKRGVFNMTLALLVTFPIMNLLFCQSYAGAWPPQVPMVSSVGSFTAHNIGGSRLGVHYVMTFHAMDGTSYTLQSNAVRSDSELRRKTNSAEKFYVRGFVLQDGRGLFWPISVSTLNGRILINSDEQWRKLRRNRNPLGELLLWEYALASPFWVISLVTALKINHRLLTNKGIE